MDQFGFTTPPPDSKPYGFAIDPHEIYRKGEARPKPHRTRFIEENLVEIARSAGSRETGILIGHVNADVAALMCMLVAREQVNNPLNIQLGDINNVNKDCKSFLEQSMKRYTAINNLTALRDFPWKGIEIMDYFTNPESYFAALRTRKADHKSKDESMFPPVQENILANISDGLSAQVTELASSNFIEYFNSVQTALMKSEDYYDTESGYHNHYSCGPNTSENQPLAEDAVLKIILSIIYPYMTFATSHIAEKCWFDRYNNHIRHSNSQKLTLGRQLKNEFDQLASPRIRRRSRRKDKASKRKSRKRSYRKSRRRSRR